MTMNFEERKINPLRLIFGLANIGYKSYAAIEDIIDNSISAKANNITVMLGVDKNKTLIEKGSVNRIIIIDDGIGMNNEMIRKALDIGSDVEYIENSLSKYGLGLKSASLSLGRKIEIGSKTAEGLSDKLTLDVAFIEEQGTYGVIIDALKEEFKKHFEDIESGTIIDISEINISDTANALKNKLTSRLGIIYHDFLTREVDPLKIKIIVNNKEFMVLAIDLLHLNESLPSFDEYSYDCKTPCRVITDKLMELSSAGKHIPPIKINAVILPQAKMASYPAFSCDEKRNIKKLDVSGNNSGFFIFRNGRLIRWGDNLSIITRDLRTFRARIDITTEHDEFLNVDVSKQNLVLPEDFLDDLALICRIPKSDAKKAFVLCTAKLEHDDDREGEQSSESVINISEEDPATQFEIVNKEIKKERRQSIINSSDSSNSTDSSNSSNSSDSSDSSNSTDSSDSSDSSNSTDSTDKCRFNVGNTFQKIRYRDYLNNTNLWQTSLDPEYGTIITINKSHQFYRLVLSNLLAADPKRQAIECFLYCVAVGENKTKENLSSVNYEDIVKTFDRFENVTSYNLQNWTAHNQDLFD